MLLVKNAAIYAPEYLGKKDLLICGGKIECIQDSIGELPVECEILDAEGKIVAEDNRNGFDENAKQQIREYLHPPKPVQKPEEKPPLENWQKYMENGEYLRSSEISEEQNYNMIDGRRNNMPPKKTRTSVLVKLHQKQAEIAKRSGKEVPQMAVAEDMERRRK